MVESVSDEEADGLVAAVQLAVNRPPQEWLYLMNSEGLPLSFDLGWSAFLGKTKGFNPAEERRFLTPQPALLIRVVPHLKENSKKNRIRIGGGRFFFSKTGVSRKGKDGSIIPVLSWSWPGESRPDAYYWKQ